MSHSNISEGEITSRVNENDDDVDGPLADILHVPICFNYNCFKEMEVLRDVSGAACVMHGALVVHEEYGILLKVLEEVYNLRSMVVTGHPGIGSYET